MLGSHFYQICLYVRLCVARDIRDHHKIYAPRDEGLNRGIRLNSPVEKKWYYYAHRNLAKIDRHIARSSHRQIVTIVTSSHRHIVRSSHRHIVTSPDRHIATLEYGGFAATPPFIIFTFISITTGAWIFFRKNLVKIWTFLFPVIMTSWCGDVTMWRCGDVEYFN